MKAKSRLKSASVPTSEPVAVPSSYATTTKGVSQAELPTPRSGHQSRTTSSNTLTARYLKHLPLLFLGLVLAFGCSVFFQTVSPSSVQNLLFPNSYLPMLIIVFITVFLLSSFVLLNTRRGLVVAAFITILLFLKLQQFEITLTLVLMLVGVFVIIELSGSILEKVLSHNAGFKPRSTTRKRS